VKDGLACFYDGHQDGINQVQMIAADSFYSLLMWFLGFFHHDISDADALLIGFKYSANDKHIMIIDILEHLFVFIARFG
jgi:hypothetical protein